MYWATTIENNYFEGIQKKDNYIYCIMNYNKKNIINNIN